MQIAIFVPQHGAIEGITPAFRAFQTANEFLTVFGKKAIFDVKYVGLKEHVSANGGEYTVRTHELLARVTKTDVVIIPPIFGDIDAGIRANAEAIPYLKGLYQKGASLASLCIGAFLLAETGLLCGKKCSTHWAYVGAFRERYPEIEVEDGAIITEHDNIYSSGGANSLWNLILYLIEKFADRETAVLISKYFALDISRDSQAQFAIFRGQRNHGDTEIQKVQDYIERHYGSKIIVDDLSRLINTGRRTFERRFKDATNNTPIEYLQRVRIEAAKKFFEASRKNVSEVMYDVGYTDTKAFRDTFRKITGLTPIEYRNRFAHVASPM
ncbi:AraC family transcriptional regulator with amidase-like domain [Sphingobacterium allocomposti]|jgi:transcriptional regulator GlxA family with amidase domain|uniref:AraC family transcriptional regulator with amidase-like domain n=1 Tax=Sphingobacterium allocomposti TaxID=415956 RepID=A0A5S5DKY1_9SPHI|nr:helix-turn-helix domain-containing protein [Sphingobacterium composti Yoo et al. 2007 non Ten et al. 2007]TYP96571.1 AraC family transcriptional regulator with amidase-like domain [Sphingobacterium composti Yoo et al. 2007 non Ten et al. 2007]HLS96041.1 helix-turn-helix domain-containing protein [Sphingobacterium sp.]